MIESEQLGGGLGLVLAVLHEMSLGEASKWWVQAAGARCDWLLLLWLRRLPLRALLANAEAVRSCSPFQKAMPAQMWCTACLPACLTPCRHGYLRALPPREYLPLFWSEEQLALLQGTELEAKVQADRYACLRLAACDLLWGCFTGVCTLQPAA